MGGFLILYDFGTKVGFFLDSPIFLLTEMNCLIIVICDLLIVTKVSAIKK